MNVRVRASFTRFLSIRSPPPHPPNPHCPHHHWATVEVVSGRGMMPNLTGVSLISILYTLAFVSRALFTHAPLITSCLPTIPQHLKCVLVLGTMCSTGASVNLSFFSSSERKRRFPDLWSPCPLRFLYYLCFTLPLALITISTYQSNSAPESSDYQTFTHCTPGHEPVWPTYTTLCHLIESRQLTDTALVS